MSKFLNIFKSFRIHFHARFSSGEVAGAAALGVELPRGQQQSQIVLLAPH